jgi:hypothetical protein
MPQQINWFFVSIAFSFVAWGVVTARYIWPELRLRERADALRPLLVLHSFRFIGLAFLVPGVVSPDLPPAFAHSAAYGDIIAAILALLSLLLLPSAACVARMALQPLGFGRSPQRLLPGQSQWAHAGTVGCHLLHSDFHRTPATDHARTRFSDSSATAECIRSTGEPAPGNRFLSHREEVTAMTCNS